MRPPSLRAGETYFALTVNLPVPLVWLYAMKDHWLCPKRKRKREKW